jgi:hypothetical protein
MLAAGRVFRGRERESTPMMRTRMDFGKVRLADANGRPHVGPDQVKESV